MFWTLLQPRSDSVTDQLRLANDTKAVHIPVGVAFMAAAAAILEQMGFRRSAEAGAGRTGDGEPMPLLSYGLIEYVDGLDLSGMDALEIGGGDSTPFWKERCKSVLTLETDRAWVEELKSRPNVGAVEFTPPEALGHRIAGAAETYDIIIIDPAASRLACARAATSKLRQGGFIILDNSEWYPNASQVLRDAGLIEVDFHDFRPAHHFRATTSIYFSPAFRPKPKGARLPVVPLGGKALPNNTWDKDDQAL